MQNLSYLNNFLPVQNVARLIQQPKKKLLVWADSPLAATGFSTATRYILDALYKTGRYEIDILAINHPPSFSDSKQYPYQMISARLGNPSDPFGNQMLANAVRQKDYDIIFINNDTFVTHQAAGYLHKIQKMKEQQGRKVFSIVYYYPVDCRFIPAVGGMVQLADRAVAYAHFGAEETKKYLPNKPDTVIYYGTDTEAFRPVTRSEKKQIRSQYLKINNDETFLLINVNRNTIRKDLARTILAFAEFRKQVPNSVLYLHARIEDGGAAGGIQLDLRVPVEHLGLQIGKDVIFPNNYSSGHGFPIEVLRNLYCASDAYITTTLGEGWGICPVDAMACGIPVIAPNNTTSPEIFGINEERGYLIPCKEKIYIDQSGYRDWCRMEDIQEQLIKCYKERGTTIQKEKIRQARLFTEKHSWENVGQQWVKLFAGIKDKPINRNLRLEGEQL